jgi:hypothetical protein
MMNSVMTALRNQRSQVSQELAQQVLNQNSNMMKMMMTTMPMKAGIQNQSKVFLRRSLL